MENLNPVVTGLIGLNIGVMAVVFITSLSEWQKKRKPWPRYRILRVPQFYRESFLYYPQVRWGLIWLGIETTDYQTWIPVERDWCHSKEEAERSIRRHQNKRAKEQEDKRRRKEFRRENKTEVIYADQDR